VFPRHHHPVGGMINIRVGGAPRIHGEPRELGIDVGQATVAIHRFPLDTDKVAFLRFDET